MSDPVAAKSGFLCMYMSSHPDTLVSYVKHWGKVSEHVTSAQMTSIDTKGMNLTYKTKAGGDNKKEVRVLFNPPLSGYPEVKPRLMSMKADADEALGITRVPQITSFQLPLYASLTGAAFGFLTYAQWAPLASVSESPVFIPAQVISKYLSPGLLAFIWYTVFATHILEVLFVLSLCRKHNTGFIVGAQYAIATVICGLPVMKDLRQRVQKARIDSIMKGQ